MTAAAGPGPRPSRDRDGGHSGPPGPPPRRDRTAGGVTVASLMIVVLSSTSRSQSQSVTVTRDLNLPLRNAAANPAAVPVTVTVTAPSQCPRRGHCDPAENRGQALPPARGRWQVSWVRAWAPGVGASTVPAPASRQSPSGLGAAGPGAGPAPASKCLASAGDSKPAASVQVQPGLSYRRPGIGGPASTVSRRLSHGPAAARRRAAAVTVLPSGTAEQAR